MKESDAPLCCPKCQAEIKPNDPYCEACGCRLKPRDAAKEDEGSQEPPDEATIRQVLFMSAPKLHVEVDAAGATHIGLVKDTNEDVFTNRTVLWPHHNIQATVMLAADGMGGGSAGEVIAEIAIAEAWKQVRKLLPAQDSQFDRDRYRFWETVLLRIENGLHAAVTATNAEVRKYGDEQHLKDGKYGATFGVLVVITDLETGLTKYFGWNEGDTRCVLINSGWLTQLSTDHTIEGAPFKFLGKRDYVSGDFFKGELTLTAEQLPTIFAVYTDGYWQMHGPERIAQICLEALTSEGACNTGIETALKVETPHGHTDEHPVERGDDNLTLLVTRIIAAKEQTHVD